MTDIFPEWHNHPMDETSLQNWYEDTLCYIHSIHEMKVEIKQEECPFRREAKARYVQDSIKNKVGDEFAEFYAWLHKRIEECAEAQRQIIAEREAMRADVDNYIRQFAQRRRSEFEEEEKHRRSEFEEELTAELQTLQNDLYNGRTTLASIGGKSSKPAKETEPQDPAPIQRRRATNTPSKTKKRTDVKKVLRKSKTKAQTTINYNFHGPATITDIHDNIHPTIQ